MTLIRFDKVCLEFGDRPLFIEADLTISANERLCLIGRNGAGKSTLLRMITGQQLPDQGEIQIRQGLRVSQLEQTLAAASQRRVGEVIRDGLANQIALLEEHHRLSTTDLDARGLQRLQVLQQQIDACGGWDVERSVETIITQLELPAEKKLCELSGGWRRRVALGRALVCKPDLLLLDEPTNHLDISTIEWLQHEIRGFSGSVVFITHDRAFLQRLATRIVELDLGRLSSWPGDYKNFLRRKEKALQDEARAERLFDKKLAQEEIWIRQGIKARRTRNEGRVRALEAMRKQRAGRLKRDGRAHIHIETAEQSSRKVLEARNISHRFDAQPLIEDFSLKIMRGDRIGLIGNNGVGKSTLLKILLGELKPDQGSVKPGGNLEIAYFDQNRTQLDPEKTVADSVSGGREYVEINGKPRHIVSYMRDFLFSPQRARTPVKALSGGECNRILLAKLFTRPANLLVMDEPTNDLDVEMLEVLEQRLVEFTGTLILVSHDREFLDHVVTSTLVFEAGGRIREYVGGYSDWLRHGKLLAETDHPKKTKAAAGSVLANHPEVSRKRPGKLSYQLQRELDGLPGHIESLEQAIATLQSTVANPGFYRREQAQVRQQLRELDARQKQLEQAIDRWAKLEALQTDAMH